MMKNLVEPIFRVLGLLLLCVCGCLFGCFIFAYFGGINGIEREVF